MNLFKQYVLDILIFVFVAATISIAAVQVYLSNFLKYFISKLKLDSYGK